MKNKDVWNLFIKQRLEFHRIRPDFYESKEINLEELLRLIPFSEDNPSIINYLSQLMIEKNNDDYITKIVDLIMFIHLLNYSGIGFGVSLVYGFEREQYLIYKIIAKFVLEKIEEREINNRQVCETLFIPYEFKNQK